MADRAHLRRIGLWVLGIAGGVLLFVALVLLGINTAPGRRFVAERIAGIEMANGLKLGIGRIDGSLYGAMTIRDLTLSDPRGVFATAPQVTLDWRPFAYAQGHLDIRSLAAPLVTVRRLPQLRPTPPSDAPLLPDLDITLGRLTVDRLVLEAPVTGQRQIAALEGQARIADRRAQLRLAARASAGDRLALTLDAVPEANRLTIDARLAAPRGGLIAGLAGLEAPLAARLAGRGDWQRWDGRLSADLGGEALARLDLAARGGTFTLRGPTRIARLVTGPSAALLGPVTTLDARSTWADRRADLTARIASDAFTFSADGIADFGTNRLEDMALAFVLLKPGAIAPNLSGRDVRAALTLNGELMRPSADYRVNATTLAFNDIAVQALDARGTAAYRGDHLVVPVAARARAITGLDAAAGGTIRNVQLDGDLAVDGLRILSDNLRIRSDRIDATAIILADAGEGLYTGALEGRVNNYRVSSVGLFNIATQADLKTAPGGAFTLVGRVRAQSTRLFNDGVRDFLGGNLAASSDVAYGTDGLIRFSRLRLNAPLLRVTDGRGSYAPDGRIDLSAAAVSRAYGPLGVQIAGTVAQPRAILTAQRPGLGVGLAGLRAQVRGTGSAYLVQASAQSDYGPVSADVAVRTAGGPLTIDVRRASLAGIAMRGTVRQSPAGPFVGRLDTSGHGVGGVVRLEAAGRFQQALVNLRANDTVLPGPANLAIGAAIVDARVTLYERPEVIADVQVAQTRLGTTELAALRAQVNYRDGRGFARGLAEGRSGVPFRIGFNGDLQPELWRVALRGRVNGIDLRTDSPARIVPGRGGYELLPTRLSFDQGSVRLAGRYGPGLAAQARLDRLDLAIANALVPGLGIGGSATGSIDFAQTGSALPRASASLAINRFTRTTAATVSRPIDINLVAGLDGQLGTLRAVMRTRGAVIGRVQADLRPAASGPWFARLANGTLSGGIRYNGPADSLFSLAGLADQTLTGNLGVAADFSGQPARPRLAGVVRGRGLTYDNTTYGTRLTDMTLAGRFTGESLQIDQLQARAGDGTVTGSGAINLAAASGYPANIALVLDNARLADSDALRVATSGNVRLVKLANQRPVLTGTVTLPETRYQIIRQGAAQVPELTGVRFKPPRGRPRVTGDAPETPASAFGEVALDLRIVAPNQLFVSGMGLEAEWSADLRVTGTSRAPRIAGAIELVRGTLGFAGRSFALQEGRIDFAGGGTEDARIRLSATEDIEDVAVTLNVTGSAFDPQIAFSSAPGLPQDEIVSRILFGNSVGSLSAIQAVQLAASLNSLRGSGGGLNPLGKLRSVAGIDRLRILGPDDATGRGTALAAGKYISDDIYLEVVTDARGFTATQLEVALSRSLSILSQAGGSGATNVNLRYRKNY